MVSEPPGGDPRVGDPVADDGVYGYEGYDEPYEPAYEQAYGFNPADFDDPRPSWAVAMAGGLGLAALLAVLVTLAPEEGDAREWWGFATVVAGPAVAVAARVAGGLRWREALRTAAAAVVVFGAGLAMAALRHENESTAVLGAAGLALGVVVAVALRGRAAPARLR
jgi:hypothetical protein